MDKKNLFTIESDQSIQAVIDNMKKNSPDFGFSVRTVLNLGEEYRAAGIEVEKGFEIFQVIVCNFTRSYQTVKGNPERAAVLLLPKQMTVYNRDGKTVVNYLPFTEAFVSQALPEEKEFPKNLAGTCQKIIKMIEASV
jgi:hypothetical protein